MIFLKKHIRLIGMFVIAVLFLLGMVGSLILWLEGVSFQEFVDILRYHNIGYILIFLVLYTIRPYTFVPSTVFMLGSLFFFEGLWTPMALAFYGSFISLIQTYWIGRLFSHKILEHSFYKKVEEYVEKMKENSFKFVFIGCASPFIPNDIVCYAAGLIKYHFGKFMAAGLLGDIPITFLYLIIAHRFYQRLNYRAFGFSIGFAFLIVLYIVFRKHLVKLFRF